MKQFVFDIQSPEELLGKLAESHLESVCAHVSSMVIQIYRTDTQMAEYQPYLALLEQAYPGAHLIGGSTAALIANGLVKNNQTLVVITCFDSTEVFVFAKSGTSGQEAKLGHELQTMITGLSRPIAGVFVLTTPSFLNCTEMFRAMEDSPITYPIFGGGAANQMFTRDILIFSGHTFFSQGLIAVIYCGTELELWRKSLLGWQPLSRTMTVTEVDGLALKGIDHKAALDVYNHYLDIQPEEDFFLTAIEFPLLLERNGQVLARIPSTRSKNGTLLLLADIHPNEQFRLGYGDPYEIMQEVNQAVEELSEFHPEAISLYNCCCRLYLFQQEAEMETKPFAEIASLAGFYTYGEIDGNGQHTDIRNASMIIIGMREGKHSQSASVQPQPGRINERKSGVVSKLVRFIGAVTRELEHSNQELARLSCTDKLTQIYNRTKLDETLHLQLEYAHYQNHHFSVILLDIDFFKHINDTFGHITGDQVLSQLASLLTANTRKSDIVGRWGGEEFMLILPHTTAHQAFSLAEKLRQTIAKTEFGAAGFRTCSFGVTGFQEYDTALSLLQRVDKALYEAKHTGRNCSILAIND